MKPLHPGERIFKSMFALRPAPRNEMNQSAFRSALAIERRRTERSQKPFLLMLAEMRSDSRIPNHELKQIAAFFIQAIRETDIVGWYQEFSTLGVIFNELKPGNEFQTAIKAIPLRVASLLRSHLTAAAFDQMCLSFHKFPEDWNRAAEGIRNPSLYPDLTQDERERKLFRIIKRGADIAGSLLLLITMSPLAILIAIAIMLTSKGPVLYRQQRAGKYGVPFAMLKFRSMYENSDSSSHREYVHKLIGRVAERNESEHGDKPVYKLTRDPRVTPLGAFLRKTSLDELPQIINVLKGEMSLIGPRPPIDYEVEMYELWHRRRLSEAKPGISGLWQVSGRNSLSFDEMVRLDLKYAKDCNPWLDLKLILKTPRAIIEGAH